MYWLLLVAKVAFKTSLETALGNFCSYCPRSRCLAWL